MNGETLRSANADILREQAELLSSHVHPTGTWAEFRWDEIEQPIFTRFEQIAAQYSQRAALKSRTYALTYAELNRAANRIAHRLLTDRPAKAEPVILYCRHDVPAIVAMLGVMKAGKFYACLDPENAGDVNRQAIAHLGAEIALVDAETEETWPVTPDSPDVPGVDVLNIEEIIRNAGPDHNPGIAVAPELPAYIVFTSGSTGRSKGVIESHASVCYHTSLFINTYHYSPYDRSLVLTRLSFGGAGVKIYPALLSGCELHVFDLRREGAGQLAQWMAEHEITEASMAVSIFRQLAEAIPDRNDDAGALPHVRGLGIGGEKILAHDIALFRRKFAKNCLLRISYGATESHFICRYVIGAGTIGTDTGLPDGIVPIGFPAGDARILLLDGSGREVNDGEVGELAVARRYLTLGYWNDPELTADRYRVDPHDPQKRMYLTGDLARRRADGMYELVGRADSMVKIRGSFVNPSDVEAALLDVAEVQHAAVVVREPKLSKPGVSQEGATLAAYVELAENAALSVSELYRTLATRLPAHMIPASITRLEEMPMTLSGKVDRRALPEAAPKRPHLAAPFAPPRTALERYLVELWENVLSISGIGVHDPFLELGGDSLRAMILVNRLQPVLGDFVFVSALFQASTVAEFAQYLRTHYGEAVAILEQENGAGADSHAHACAPMHEQAPETKAPESDEPDRVLGVVREWLALQRQRISTVARPSEPNPAAVFVLSPPRSGSTLLRVMLGGHPMLFAPPELSLLYFDTLGEMRRMWATPGDSRREGVVRAVMEARQCGVEEASDLIEQMEDENLSTRAVYRRLQQWISPRLLVDKTPGYSGLPDPMQRAERDFDGAKYIHLLRHPCGMIHSYVGTRLELLLLRILQHEASGREGVRAPVDGKWPFPIEKLAEATWLIHQQNILGFFESVPEQRRLQIRFEDVVRHPKQSMERICAFLGLPMDEEMLHPYGESKRRMTDGVTALSLPAGDVKFRTHSSIDASVADKWRAHYDEAMLWDVTRQVAARLGYAGDGGEPGQQTETDTEAETASGTDEIEELISLVATAPEATVQRILHGRQVDQRQVDRREVDHRQESGGPKS